MATKSYWIRFGSGDPRTYTGLAPTFLIFALADGTAVTPPAIAEHPASSGLYNFAWGTTTSIGFLADAATTSPGTSGRYVTGSLDPVDEMDFFGTSLVALGTTAVSWGSANSTALTNEGTTLVAIGNTSIAQGVIEIGLGTTAVSWGLANNTQLVNEGSTLVAIGNTAIAFYETMILSDVIALGTTVVAIGNTSIAIGTSMAFVLQGIGSTASTYGGASADPVDLFGYMKRIQENLEGNNTYTKLAGTLSIYSRASATLLITKTVTNSVTTVIKT